MKRLIDAVCYLGAQEIALRGHDESSTSNNRGNYVELLHFLAKYDETLSSYLNNATVFSGLSNRIQNDIIESISNVMLSLIKNEVLNSKFVAIMVDETSDISHKSQLSVVLRYVANNQPVERFIGFFDVSADKTALAISKFIKEIIESWGFGAKLVAQTYDGAAVMSGSVGGIQKLIRDVYPRAIFIHCYAHVLNLVLQQSVSFIKECKVFFSSLDGLASFFSNSTKRNNALDDIVKKKFPQSAHTRWIYSSRLVNTAQQFWEPLCELFEEILENPNNWDSETICLANGQLNFLNNFNTVFLLHTFSEVFSYTDLLYNILQKTNVDLNICINQIKETNNKIRSMRNEFDSIFTKAVGLVGEPKRRRNQCNEEIKTTYKRIFNEILDTISTQMDERFKNSNELKFLELLNPKLYSKYEKNFPDKAFNCLKSSYGEFFDEVKLKNELQVLYSSENFKDKEALKLLNHIVDCDLKEVLSETSKLCELIITIPYSTAEVERSFSALKRIKSYSRNKMNQDRLSSLALMSIESSLLSSLKSKSIFYEKVIDDFAKKERRIELLFK